MGSSDDTGVATVADPLLDAAEQLAARMAAAWRGGDRRGADAWLASRPALLDAARTTLRLVEEELRLREEDGEPVSAGDFAARLPRWAAEIRYLFACREGSVGQPLRPHFPEPGETLAGFRILSELGRGALGRVFRARETYLAGRPVVLKVTPLTGQEHLALARLQHTHVVPLYSAQDVPERGLRLLCMPDLGGVPLDRLFAELRRLPVERRCGADLCAALRRCAGGDGRAERSEACESLYGLSYVEAVCRIGVCLADALAYAHARGLVHLDIKPSNVLLTADGQPLLLDFHLARAPLACGDAEPEQLGGTPAYMAPEQWAAWRAFAAGRPITTPIDGRSDVYALGLLLREALAPPGAAAAPVNPAAEVGRFRHLPVGLRDVLARCLAAEPAARYAGAAELADDLRRHLADEPLRGVANRCWRERWGKWRRRRPLALPLWCLEGAVAAALALLVWVGAAQHLRDEQAAREAITLGQQLTREGRPDEAVRLLQDTLDDACGTPWAGRRAADLRRQLRLARRALAARELHRLAERLRYLSGEADPPAERLRELEAAARSAWEARAELFEGGAEGRAELHNDLLDLAVGWNECRVRLAGDAGRAEALRQGLRVLDEAEGQFGPDVELCCQRQLYAEALGRTEEAREAAARVERLAPHDAWDHYALGRWRLGRGELEEAAAAFEAAVRAEPRGFWPWWWSGLCAQRRGRYDEAVTAFSVCAALEPQGAACFYNRALAYAAAGDAERARRDYDRALELEPALGAALLKRGVLSYREGKPAEAEADLRRAADLGADPVAVHFNLALLHEADRPETALRHVEEALRRRPDCAEALRLQAVLRERTAPPCPPSP